MFEEFNLKHYYSPCNYYPHLKCDETNFPMWSSSRNSFPDLGKNGFPGEKKKHYEKYFECFIEVIMCWHSFFPY